MSIVQKAKKSLAWSASSLVCAAVLACTLAPSLAHADDVSDVQALLANGNSAAGLKKVDELLKAKPTDARLRLQRGIALSLLGRNPEAIEVFKKLVASNPEMPGPYNNLAVLYANQGDYEKARESLEKAVKANPGYATAYQNLGDIHARLAEKAYAKSLSLDKSDLALPLKIAAVQNIFEPGAPVRASAPLPAPAKPAAIAAATATPAPAKALVEPSKAVDPLTSAVINSLAHQTNKPAQPAAVAAVPALAVAAKPASPAPATKVEPAVNDSQAIQKALETWAQAWSKRDIWGYFAAYSPEFKGKAASRKAWEADRIARISSKKEISVVLSDIQVKLSGNTATASFKQDYRADALTMKNDKTLTLQKGKTGDWQISSESSN
ncbi:MAG: tetratricopeptide repeat protein [Paucibacter sp.]|nr:tetratricopeptide repeat protein [Roseateles sp.]